MFDMDSIVIAGRKYSEARILKEKEEYIRLEAVDLCFALSALVYDKSVIVRAAVARKGVGHEILVNDESWRVRAIVAKYTDEAEYLNVLANDKNDFVRFVVVKRGWLLDLFVDDIDEEIASIARYQIQNSQVA